MRKADSGVNEICVREVKILNEEAIRCKILKEVGNHGNNIRVFFNKEVQTEMD